MEEKKIDKKIIGRSEYINLPEFSLEALPAKIDTGAYRGALHCHTIVLSMGGDELYFKLLDPTHAEYDGLQFKTSDFARVRVRHSDGTWTKRYKIKTTVELAGEIFPMEFTLTDRTDMRFPVLIGRKALKKRFLVDASKRIRPNTSL